VPCIAGTKARVRVVVHDMMLRVDHGSPLRGPTIASARTAYLTEVVHARSLAEWRRHSAWVEKFLVFARDVCRESGLPAILDKDLLRDNVLARYFLARVAAEHKGRTRPAAARRALSLERGRLGAPTLNEDLSIRDVVRAAVKAVPTTPKQAQALHASDVHALVRYFHSKGSWYYDQLATIVAIGFYRLLRLGELRLVAADGMRFVLTDGSEVPAGASEPNPKAVRAVLLHVSWRKQHNAMDTWIPVSGTRSIAMLLRQRALVRESGAAFLFPSRVHSRKGDRTHVLNPIGSKQFITELRSGLWATLFVGTSLPRSVLDAFAGHSLRVGGLNELRRRGVDSETRRLLGGWASVMSQARYEQLSIKERLHLSESLARGKRKAGFGQPAACLAALQHLDNFAY
jgi:hypothetical protein